MWKSILVTTACALGFGGLVVGQVDSIASRYAGTITAAELQQHLSILASDAYMGRDTGKEGQKMAAAYLKNEFVKAGIPPVPAPDPTVITEGYYQPFPLIEERSGSIGLVTPTDRLGLKDGLLYFGENLRVDRTVKEFQWLGKAKLEPRKKAVSQVVLLHEDGSLSSPLLLGWARGQMELLKAQGAEVVLIATPRLKALLDEMAHHVGGTRMRLAESKGSDGGGRSTPQMILVDEARINGMLNGTTWAKLSKKKGGRKVAADLTLTYTPQASTVVAENVLAFIEGTDKKDEIVVLTAHYDHIGVENGIVYNGADDDGTGTVAMIEIAGAFAQAKAAGHGPRRSVLVMPVSGEEKGLLGSRYYSEHPVFPLENTVADLNIDMIGRTDTAHTSTPPYVYIIGSDRLSSDLHAINEQANTGSVKIDLDYRFNAESDPNRFYYRSDHYNFARKGVPSIFYFSGVHEDYHQPGDDVEKIRFDLLHQRTLLVFHTAWILANREQRIVVDKPVKP